MNRRRFLTASVVVSLAGCVAQLDDSSEPDPETLLEDAIDTRMELETLTGRRTITADSDNGGMERTERLVERPPGKRRVEVLEATNATVSSGQISVSTRDQTWEYDPETTVATQTHHPHRITTDRVRLVLESALEKCCLTYGGTETVADRETHRVEIGPPPDADVERSIDIAVGDTQYVIPIEEVPPEELEDAEVVRTIAIADEERYPLEERTVVRTDETELHSLTAGFEQLTIDDELDEASFEYEPPADAEVETDGLEPEAIYDSRSAADAAVPYALPEPAIPDPYTLDRVTVVEKSDQLMTTLWYLDPQQRERELYVAVREEPRFNEDVLDPIDLDGHEAFYRDGRIESVFWNCEGLSYEVSSPDVAEPVEEIATSVGCS